MIYRAKRIDNGEVVEFSSFLTTTDDKGVKYLMAIPRGTKCKIRNVTRQFVALDPATLQQKIGDHWLTPGQVEALVCCGNCRYLMENDNPKGKDGRRFAFYECQKITSAIHMDEIFNGGKNCKHWQPRAESKND